MPPAISVWIRNLGYEALHINEFTRTRPVSDQAIRHYALHKDWVVVSKDDDFVKSYVSRKVPERLIYVFGTYTRTTLLERWETAFDEIVRRLESGGELLELNPSELKTIS